jgi:HSP20 family protein
MASRSVIPFMFGGSPLARSRGDGDPALSLFRDMDRLFGSVLGLSGAGAGGAGLPVMPRINVSETDNEIRIEAELPGVSENEVEVSLSGDMLTIRGEKKAEQEEKRQNYHVMERSYGSFARSVQLPFAIRPDQVQASFQNGVLTITLPKSAAQDQVHRIQVQGTGASSQAGTAGSGIDRAAAGDKPSGAGAGADTSGGGDTTAGTQPADAQTSSSSQQPS